MRAKHEVTRFACNHIGRSSEGSGRRRAKVAAFIRVAEIRGAPVLVSVKKCPDCGQGRGEGR